MQKAPTAAQARTVDDTARSKFSALSKSSHRTTPRFPFKRPVIPPRLVAEFDVQPAIQGNHLAIQAFLQRVLHKPSQAEFNAAVLRPDYQPSERMVIKHPHDRAIVGHVQIESFDSRFGRVDIPTSRLHDLAVLPEYLERGFDDQLVRAAESEAKRRGAMLMITRGQDCNLLSKRGWVPFGCDPVSVVSPQRLLGQLPPPAQPESPYYADRMPVWGIRIGRLTDITDLSVVFEEYHAGTHGPRFRSAEHWAWLLTKQSHDRIYLFHEASRLMAYVVVRGAAVIELADLTDDGRGTARVLECVAADAIDQGRHSLEIHARLDALIHTWADLAGGQLFACTRAECWMVKVLSMRSLLRRLANLLHRRKPKGSFQLGMTIGDDSFLLKQGVRSVKITRCKPSDCRLAMSPESATHLLLGFQTVDELIKNGKLIVGDDDAINTSRELFPAVNQWRTHWEDATMIRR